MKNLILIAAACIAVSWISMPETKVLMGDHLDKKPKFVGGQEALIKFISESVKYPEEAKKKEIQGTTHVGFFVAESGEIVEVKVVRSSNTILDKEAVRVVESMPNWEPGEKAGKKVKVDMVLPITFKL